MPLKTATDFAKLVENKLGWINPRPGPEFKRYQSIAKRVVDKMTEDRVSFDDLELAVELLWRERKPRSPMGVFAHVERARAKSVDIETDVEVEIRHAMAVEEQAGDPEGWVIRFSRATGPYRREALNEWKARWAQSSRGRD